MVIVNFPNFAVLFVIAGFPALCVGYFLAPGRGTAVRAYFIWAVAALLGNGFLAFAVFYLLEASLGSLERALRVGYYSALITSLAWVPCSMVGYGMGILRRRWAS